MKNFIISIVSVVFFVFIFAYLQTFEIVKIIIGIPLVIAMFLVPLGFYFLISRFVGFGVIGIFFPELASRIFESVSKQAGNSNGSVLESKSSWILFFISTFYLLISYYVTSFFYHWIWLTAMEQMVYYLVILIFIAIPLIGIFRSRKY